MKKILFSIIVFFSLIPLINGLEINSNNAILYNLDDNTILYEKNSNEIITIASLTKITTTIVAIENIKSLDEKVVMTSKMFEGLKEANASVAEFKLGQVVTYRDLLYGAMLPSGADATKALAIMISGSEEEFVKLMNNKANSLGLKNTHYMNSSGLDADKHYSTVSDVAIILQYALQNKTFKEIFTSKEYITSDNKIKMESPVLRNSRRYNLPIDYILGGKTGFTDKAGYCLASIANNKDINYMLVTAISNPKAKQPLNFLDAINIYSYVFDNYEYQNILNVGDLLTTVNVSNSNITTLPISSNESISAYLPRNSIIEYDYIGISEVNSEYEMGDKIGELLIKSNGEVIKKIDILLPLDLKMPIPVQEGLPKTFFTIGIILLLVFMFFVGKYKNKELNYGNK